MFLPVIKVVKETKVKSNYDNEVKNIMTTKPSISSMMNSLIPISRFNRGEANKIFSEVNADGDKIVLKNNTPICVLLNPPYYEAIIDALEDYALFFEAENRTAGAETGYISSEKVLTGLGITEADLEDVEVEI